MVGENMPVSFKIYDVLISETKQVSAPVDEETLSVELEEAAYNQALAGGADPDDVTGVNVIVTRNGKDMKVSVIIEALEEITQAHGR